MPSRPPGENSKIALLIAVIALCLALSETLGKGAQTEVAQQECRGLEPVGLLPGQEHPPQRGADRRRTRQVKSRHRRADDAAKAALQKQIDDWQKTAERYRSDPKTGEGQEQLSERAKEAEHERDEATANTTTSSLALQLSRSPSCWRRRPSSPA